MKKYLALVEKPSACREYQAVYNKHKAQIDAKIGGSIDFIPLAGHCARLLEPKEIDRWAGRKWTEIYKDSMPIIPDKWEVRPIEANKNILSEIKKKMNANKYTDYICACDSDNEGSLIFYYVAQYLGILKEPTLRFYETALTEKEILKSFLTMEDYYKTPKHANMTKAGILRSRADYAIGMSMTVAYTVRYGELIKFGSVKAPTLKIIYDNCYIIDHFKEVITYGVKSLHVDGFESTLTNDGDAKDRSFEKKEDAEFLLKSLKDEAVVKSYVKKNVTNKAPKLYALSDLQIEAAKAPYGYTPDQTLEIAQKLYEERKILSYPRTSGNYLASSKVAELPDILASIKDIPDIKPFVARITNADYTRVASDTNIINDKEVEKASHDALVPTGHKVDWDALTQPEKDIFLLVCKRLVAHFMPYFTEEKVVMMLDNNGNPFRANGRRTVENGFNEIYGKVIADEILPEYKAGDVVKIEKSYVIDKVSAPPARYTTGTIIKAMKNIANQIPVENEAARRALRNSSGIGTEATRANIVKDLQDTGYITTKKNAIYITESGKRYIENIRVEKDDGTFDYGIADPITVAYWSAKYQDVQLGEGNIQESLSELTDYLTKTIEDLKASGEPVKAGFSSPATANLPPCPLCGGRVASGKFGLYCSTYKESGCKLSIPNEMAHKPLTDNQKLGLLEGKKIHAKGFKSKTGKTFEADIILNKQTGKVEFDFSFTEKKK